MGKRLEEDPGNFDEKIEQLMMGCSYQQQLKRAISDRNDWPHMLQAGKYIHTKVSGIHKKPLPIVSKIQIVDSVAIKCIFSI